MKKYWSEHLYVKTSPYNIAFIKFIFEGYDNLAYTTVIDNTEAIIKVTFTKEYTRDVLEVLKSLGLEVFSL